MSMLRNVARGVAHHRMKKKGIVRPNKNQRQSVSPSEDKIDLKRSYFAEHWKEFV